MLANLRARREDDERGFTLIELMVVVLIIAILIAIAIPTFLGARNRASDRAAQSDLRNALTAAKTSFTDNDAYPPQAGVQAALDAIEPSLTYQAAGDVINLSNTISVFSNGSDTFVGAAWAKDSKTCFFIKDVTSAAGATTYGASATNPATCAATSVAPAGITFTSHW
jgi:type IV pilus assembly protein PilA